MGRSSRHVPFETRCSREVASQRLLVPNVLAEIQLRHGRSRLTRTNVLRAEQSAMVTLMLVDALVVLYDLRQLMRFI